jgi:hypothetical protein
LLRGFGIFAVMNLSEKEQKVLVKELPADLQLSGDLFVSEAEILAALARKVEDMLQYNRDVFFQLMYRLDILEPKLRVALQQQDVPMAIARLIYERQTEKIVSRRDNKGPQPIDDDLSW